jgi:DNA-binding response OmpR family regulator
MTSILVVEHDPAVRDFMAEVLKTDLAAAVSSCSTGEHATAAIATGAFDLAVIDVGMPDISGYELARCAANMNIPTLLCTGHPDSLARLEAAGCPYLAKPFGTHELIGQAAAVIARAAENISRVSASLTRLRVTIEGLEVDLAESRRLVNESTVLLVEPARVLRDSGTGCPGEQSERATPTS